MAKRLSEFPVPYYFPALVKMYYDASCQISLLLPHIHSAKYTVQFSRGTKLVMVLVLIFFFFLLKTLQGLEMM